MHVDEAGCNDQTFRIDNFSAVPVLFGKISWFFNHQDFFFVDDQVIKPVTIIGWVYEPPPLN